MKPLHKAMCVILTLISLCYVGGCVTETAPAALDATESGTTLAQLPPSRRQALAEDASTAADILRILARDSDSNVRWRIAGNLNTPEDLLAALAEDPDMDVRTRVLQNPHTPKAVRNKLIQNKKPPPLPDLTPPVEVTQAMIYRDGGTLGLVMRDSKGKEFACCIDRRIGSLTQGRFFVGGTHTAYGAEQMTEPGDAVQREVEEYLRTWISRLDPAVHGEIANVRHGVALSEQARKAQIAIAVQKYLADTIESEGH